MDSSKHLGHRLKIINDTIVADGNAIMKEKKLTLSQVRLLVFLRHHGGSAHQKELEDFFGVTHPTLIGIIKRLEAKGMVAVSIDNDDRRARIISLTESGDKECDYARKGVEKVEAILVEGFTEEEIIQLGNMLDRVMDNLRKNVNTYTQKGE